MRFKYYVLICGLLTALPSVLQASDDFYEMRRKIDEESEVYYGNDTAGLLPSDSLGSFSDQQGLENYTNFIIPEENLQRQSGTFPTRTLSNARGKEPSFLEYLQSDMLETSDFFGRVSSCPEVSSQIISGNNSSLSQPISSLPSGGPGFPILSGMMSSLAQSYSSQTGYGSSDDSDPHFVYDIPPSYEGSGRYTPYSSSSETPLHPAIAPHTKYVHPSSSAPNLRLNLPHTPPPGSQISSQLQLSQNMLPEHPTFRGDFKVPQEPNRRKSPRKRPAPGREQKTFVFEGSQGYGSYSSPSFSPMGSTPSTPRSQNNSYPSTPIIIPDVDENDSSTSESSSSSELFTGPLSYVSSYNSSPEIALDISMLISIQKEIESHQKKIAGFAQLCMNNQEVIELNIQNEAETGFKRIIPKKSLSDYFTFDFSPGFLDPIKQSFGIEGKGFIPVCKNTEEDLILATRFLKIGHSPDNNKCYLTNQEGYFFYAYKLRNEKTQLPITLDRFALRKIRLKPQDKLNFQDNGLIKITRNDQTVSYYQLYLIHESWLETKTECIKEEAGFYFNLTSSPSQSLNLSLPGKNGLGTIKYGMQEKSNIQPDKERVYEIKYKKLWDKLDAFIKCYLKQSEELQDIINLASNVLDNNSIDTKYWTTNRKPRRKQQFIVNEYKS